MAQDKWHRFLEEIQQLVEKHKVEEFPPADWLRADISIEINRNDSKYITNEIRLRLHTHKYEDGWDVKQCQSRMRTGHL